MKFSTRIALSIALVSGLALLTLGLVTYDALQTHERAQFSRVYSTQLDTAGEMLRQLEEASGLIAENALRVWQEREARDGLVPDAALAGMTHELHVANMFATTADGTFIRSTNGDTNDFKPNLFQYCDSYREILQGPHRMFRTPILSAPDGTRPGPYTYTMTPNHAGNHILEVSISSAFLESSLFSALRNDPAFRSLTFSAPNGDVLGHLSADPHAPRPRHMPPHDAAAATLRWSEAADGAEGTVTLTKRIAVMSTACCECEVKGLDNNEPGYAYYLTARYSTAGLAASLLTLRTKIAAIFGLLLLIMGATGWIVARTLVRGLGRVGKAVEAITVGGDLSARLNIVGSDEVSLLAQRFDKMAASLEAGMAAQLQVEKARAIADAAAQLAHDIRSPLAALEVVETCIGELPEDIRVLQRSAIGRVRDIANSLLSRGRAIAMTTEPSQANDRSVHLLGPLLGAAVSEKRVQYASRLTLDIAFVLEPACYGLFASIDRIAFQRVISNLLNNAAEAIKEAGHVRVTLAAAGAAAVVTVEDDGCGMPPHVVEQVGELGITYGKDHGSGRGLYHAKRTIEAWGGSLAVESSPDAGTRVRVLLPAAAPPPWFVARLLLPSSGRVVVLDDDPAIHAIWDRRLRPLDANVVHFSAASVLRTWLATEAHDADILLLMDYELIGQATSGLDLIIEEGLQATAILVTSHHEEAHIIARCAEHGVRILPKNMVSVVPTGRR